jgi:hypothetical protein
MGESIKQHSCDNCGSRYQLIYDIDEVSYEADNCPFCGDVLNEEIEIGFDGDEAIDWDDGDSSDDEDE